MGDSIKCANPVVNAGVLSVIAIPGGGTLGLNGIVKLRLIGGCKLFKLLVLYNTYNCQINKDDGLKNSFRYSQFLNIDNNNSPNNSANNS